MGVGNNACSERGEDADLSDREAARSEEEREGAPGRAAIAVSGPKWRLEL